MIALKTCLQILSAGVFLMTILISQNASAGTIAAEPEKPKGTPLNPEAAADFNGDGFVDDSDMVLFTNQYNVMLCTEAAMPGDCTADLNHDGQVDDADFVLFWHEYNRYTANIS